MASLLWNPLLRAFKDHFSDGQSVVGMIAPYCTQAALMDLIEEGGPPEYVVVSWKLADLTRGVGDVSVYESLLGVDVPLYINRSLHAKIFTFSDRRAICGSGNITARGLGLIADHNVECAVSVTLDLEDEIALRQLRDSSLKVTQDVYEEFQEALEGLDLEALGPDVSLKEDELYAVNVASRYLISCLPATKTPAEFFEVFESFRANDRRLLQNEELQRAISDVCTFGLSVEKPLDEVAGDLRQAFISHPFVMEVYAKIREEGSMRFGAVTEFVQKTCRDVPMPFRREIKETVNTLYNWLCYFYDDLDWHQPGERSQVIYYTKAESESE